MNAPAASHVDSPFIKLCGMTTPAAVAAALACEVNAIGFVFAPSVRRVTITRANELAAAARHKVACVAVTRHPTRAEVDEIVRDFKPDILQTDLDDLDALDLPQTLSVLPVLRAGPRAACGMPRRVLFEGPASGAGQTTDWNAAADLARRVELILAGGLDPLNVAVAIRQVRPFGVDVSSGIESEPGIKSTGKIELFVAAARMAALEFTE
jgi:phosphoribosylanthranilate isomerase